jgi:hypothetical protein
MFLINGSDLKPCHANNFLDKYADDSYLIVGSNNESTVTEELSNIEKWSHENNLNLNKSKSKEIIFTRIRNDDQFKVSASPIPNVERVKEIKILGITIDDNFSVTAHISNIIENSLQSFYAIKILKNHGLPFNAVKQVFNSLVISKLTYACPSWWGFTTEGDKNRLQSILRKAIKWNFYGRDDPSIELIIIKRENSLFKSVLSNPNHVLHQFLPPVKLTNYKLRARTHCRTLPPKPNSLVAKNFLCRMLYKDCF